MKRRTVTGGPWLVALLLTLGLHSEAAAHGCMKITPTEPISPESEEGIPGTSGVLLSRWSDSPSNFAIGDRVRLKCVFFGASSDDVPCDSTVITSQLGTDDLPLGIEWALLRVYHGYWIDWTHPIALRKQFLDGRFTRCEPSANGFFRMRVALVEIDTTARAKGRGSLAEMRTAVSLMGRWRWEEAAALLKPLIERRSRSALLQVLYATTLQGSRNHSELERQHVVLTKLGYGPE
jgi:hypothetical protein